MTGNYDPQIFRFLNKQFEIIPKIHAKIYKTPVHKYTPNAMGRVSNPYDMYVDFLSGPKNPAESYLRMLTACAWSAFVKENTTEDIPTRAANAVITLSRHLIKDNIVNEEINLPSPQTISTFLKLQRDIFKRMVKL